MWNKMRHYWQERQTKVAVSYQRSEEVAYLTALVGAPAMTAGVITHANAVRRGV